MGKSTPAEIARRKNAFAELPWVKKLKNPAPQCEGIKWGQVALRDIFEHGPRATPTPPRGIPEKARCKRRAAFRYSLTPKNRPLRTVKGWVHEANLCWTHASIVLYDNDQQYARLKAWQKRGEAK